jgi:hypothetical protein
MPPTDPAARSAPALVRYSAEHADQIVRWPVLARDLAWWFGLTGDETGDRGLLDRRCDYVRMSREDEAEFNAGQPRPYVWMRPSTR